MTQSPAHRRSAGLNGLTPNTNSAALMAAGGFGAPQPEQTEQPTRKPNPFSTSYTMDELLAMPPKQWLVDSFIGENDIAMIYGGSGSGKTFVMVDLIGEMCSGGTFANRFKVVRPLNVAYCAGEGVSGLPGRFRSMIERKGLSSLPNFRFWKQAPQLAADRNGQMVAGNIRQFIEAYTEGVGDGSLEKLDVLIIDTLHTATVGADENSAGDMGRVLESCREAMRLLGCTVILVHHTGKNGEYRGSSSLKGDMDYMIQIKRISDGDTKAVLCCEKVKDGIEWKQQTFDLVSHGESAVIWWDDPIDNVETGKQDNDRNEIIDVLKKAKAKLTAKQIAQGIGKGESTQVYKLLKQLVDGGQIISELREVTGKASKSNPWLYSLENSN